MGEGLIKYYKTTLKKEYKIAFFATFIIALLIHIYKFTNALPNHDSLYNYYTDQDMTCSGRWALSLACSLSSYYDLPWVNGLLSCVFIALTVVCIVALFNIKNPVLIGLSGALLAASPGTTETFFFLYTADGYMIAMFMSALAVYLSRIEEKRIWMRILSGVLICVSCAIYQAYVSFALVLALCYLIKGLFEDKYTKKEAWKWILTQAIIYIAALAAYFIIWKLCLQIFDVAAKSYQGIAEVGKINISMILRGFVEAVKSVGFYFVQWDIVTGKFTLYSVLNIIFLTVMFAGLIIAVGKSGVFKRKWALVLILLCLAAIIPFACIWHFTSETVSYRPMMLQCMILLFILTALLYEKWANVIIKNVVCLFLCTVVLSNAVMANVSYFYMQMCYERTYADGAEMMAQIHELQDEYEFDKIAVLGSRKYDIRHDMMDAQTGELTPAGKFNVLSSLLEENLLYSSSHVILYLKATFGLELELIGRKERNALLDEEEIKAMPCWPSHDAMTVRDGVLIIKLSDRKEGE